MRVSNMFNTYKNVCLTVLKAAMQKSKILRCFYRFGSFKSIPYLWRVFIFRVLSLKTSSVPSDFLIERHRVEKHENQFYDISFTHFHKYPFLLSHTEQIIAY